MLKLLGFILVVAGGAYIFPQLYEEQRGPCQALETKAIRLNTEGAGRDALSNLAVSLTDGAIARDKVARDYPNLPPRLGCVIAYYNFPEDWRL